MTNRYVYRHERIRKRDRVFSKLDEWWGRMSYGCQTTVFFGFIVAAIGVILFFAMKIPGGLFWGAVRSARAFIWG
jgi:hypothetical protein